MNSTMIDALTSGFVSAFGDSTDMTVAMAPGRVNLIGDYTDFNDGFVLPMTVDRGVYIALRKRDDSRVRVRSLRYGETLDYEPGSGRHSDARGWANYVVGVIEELHARGLLDTGFDGVVDGDLPLGAGLSSSAALEVATAVGLQSVFGFEMGDVDMVRLCQYVEHHYANVLCGIMDQFACRIGRSGHALFLDCRSLDYEAVPVDLSSVQVVIIASGVGRSLMSSAYNERRRQCEQAVDHFRAIDSSVRALRDVGAEMLSAHGEGLTPIVARRCRHVVAENERVMNAAAALRSGRIERVGELMSESHRSLRDDFEVSCPELDALVDLAEATDGVLGARMTGAGFGGCTVNLVRPDAVASLRRKLERDYTARFGLEPDVYVLERNLEAGEVVRA